jgi:NAD(P)-dependent dehydrogenase (short-subunit alcohol dehydrogenase family)
MPADFAVSKAVITGGAQGLGAAIARRLALEGMSVSLLDIQADRAKETAEDIALETGSPTFSFACDVRDRAAVQQAFASAAEAMGGLDTYIGNAGITRDRMFHRLSDDDWDQVIAVNLTGVYVGLRAAAPWLRTDGPGRVVLISSMVANTGNLGQMNYTAAKAGVVGLVRTGALELARFGTTVNGVRPGFIETAMTAAMPPEAQKQMTANPMGRPGQPEDIAGAVAYLCSQDASFVTGQLIDVNGGADF